ncbi:hypothetical protein RFI_35497 [Reticulomyxa filosa]|uniref:Uncharacterized protein n=1 Tax=Reticulomyxa filosa TaxID=46433 RepID=X6LKR8_RETFI|nr:hypothetical protein RFI_35497 [Reticulomyxa filosa]|eukprot:ETO01941.1 hypothetical protein RFI_35497 [Reticulomyxa filosa]
MIDTTNIIRELHKQLKSIALDNNWNNFVTELNKICHLFLNECKPLKSELMVTTSASIEEMTQCFDICYKCFPESVSNCTEFLDLCINNEPKIAELVNNENLCNFEHFVNTMDAENEDDNKKKFMNMLSLIKNNNLE